MLIKDLTSDNTFLKWVFDGEKLHQLHERNVIDRVTIKRRKVLNYVIHQMAIIVISLSVLYPALNEWKREKAEHERVPTECPRRGEKHLKKGVRDCFDFWFFLDFLIDFFYFFLDFFNKVYVIFLVLYPSGPR